MRLKLAPLTCLLAAACTFPIKNDRIDTAAQDEFSNYGQIPVVDIDTCDEDQLVTEIEFRMGGTIVNALDAGENAQVWAIVGNQCKNTFTFTTNTTCLVEGWSIENPSVGSASGSFVCESEPVTRELNSGQALQRMLFPLNDLPVGVYSGQVIFSVTGDDGVLKSRPYSISVD
jgi:hypothetical protein